MQRLVFALLMSLVLTGCGSDGDTIAAPDPVPTVQTEVTTAPAAPAEALSKDAEAVKRIAAAGDGSAITKGGGQCALPAACLDLSDLGITSLPAEIGLLTKLEELRIWDNQITALPPEIGQLTKLQEVRFSRNQLTSLPAEIGLLTNLQELYLSTNQLTTLPPEIGQLPNLQWLDLDANQLTSLPPEIGQLPNLEQLYLSKNKLTTLPPEIERLPKLRVLYVEGNPLDAASLALLQRLEARGVDVKKPN